MSLLLIAFTLVSFVIWGRGTFCGWLCPFGALQEFAALLARALRLPERKLPARLAEVLDRGRFVILAALAALAAIAPQWAEKGVELEPFMPFFLDPPRSTTSSTAPCRPNTSRSPPRCTRRPVP